VEAAAAQASATGEVLARLQSLGYMGGISPAPGEGRLDPKQMLPIYNKIAEIKKLASSGQVQQALQDLQQVAANAPKSRAILGQLATLYVVLGQLPQAEHALRESIAIQPHVATFVLLGQILVAQGRYDEGEALADEALRMDASNGLALIIKGDVASAEGREAEAKELYYRAAVADPYRTGPGFQQRRRGGPAAAAGR
jgi:tetratricopeptide (TPR) repeat protein